MKQHLLHIDNLAIGYALSRRSSCVVADQIDASLQAGELVCLIGPNGVGKSTLLRTIAGMQPPLSGHVHLLGKDVHAMTPRERARQLAVVLTERMNTGLLSAYELVTLGRHPYTGWLGDLTPDDHRIVARAFESVEAQTLAERTCNELSDGERQRIMIARALAQEPVLMILDEPTAFLDLPRRIEMMYLLRELTRNTGCAVLLSTHDLDLALRCADRLWLLSATGSIQTGIPEELILSGALEAAFASATIQFNTVKGTFEKRQGSVTPVILDGEGVQYVWTRHALEREGFAVAAEHHPSYPQIVCQPGTTSWQLTVHGQTHLCRSITELVNLMRQIRDKHPLQSSLTSPASPLSTRFGGY